MSQDIPLLAPDSVRQLRELGGEELLRRMVVLLLELTPQRLSVLAEAIRHEDLAAARLAAHALCSTAGAVGALQLLDAARLIEAASTIARAQVVAAILEAEWHRLEAPLGRWLAGPGAAE